MNQVIEFMKELLEEMEDNLSWHIVSMENFEEVTTNNSVYARLKDGSMYEKQDDIYINQSTEITDDDFHGTIIKPITESVALVIQYEC